MGTTKDPIFGTTSASGVFVPARSRGPLGRNDAADPDVGMCMAGDTPGAVGTAGDAGTSLFSEEPVSLETLIPVFEVDITKLRRFVYTVALAEETDRAATHGFASAEVQLGDKSKIEASARKSADDLLVKLEQAVAAGPEAVTAFNSALEERKARARKSLDTKFAEAQKAGSNWVSVFGWTAKSLVAIKFASTVTIKTVSIFTGPAGTGIDWVYSGAQAGIEHVQSGDSKQTVSGVVVLETASNVGEELVETLNELVAEGLMTTAEKNRISGLISNYKGNSQKLQKQLLELEEKIRSGLETGKDGKKVKRLVTRQTEKLAKLQALRKKTAGAFLKKGMRTGIAKKVAGKAFSFVFLRQEIIEAWDDAVKEWQGVN